MKTAVLYIRVSTDEQADKGYSLQHQEESLRKYCLHNDIEVRKVVKEDYSAKTFRRPAWTEMLDEIRKRKIRTNLVLFTKWDRFSRNAGDAYQMISILRKLGVEPQGIEQPLDLSVPENKMMLAFYLAAPEVENDRRALNVFHGMRRARKEGRWLWKAPYGYRNRSTPEGRPTIVVHKEEAAHLKWIYTTIAEGNYSSEQIVLQARKNGAKLKKNNFWWLIRNPFYYGKIFVPPYKDEPGMFVKGQHQPIISEALFKEAQLVLDGKKRKRRTQVVTSEQIPLRGFLDCPKCTRALTASASKGRKQYYHYYHCTSKCGVRFKADDVNNAFVKQLARFKPKSEFIGVIKTIFSQLFEKERKLRNKGRTQIADLIDQENEKMAKARKLLLNEAITPEDYKEMKRDFDAEITSLEIELDKIAPPLDQQPIRFLDSILELASSLDNLYVTADSELKRRIVGSIYPKNWCFDGKQHRTTFVNEALRCFYLINNMLESKKISPKSKFSTLDSVVGPPGLEPGTS